MTGTAGPQPSLRSGRLVLEPMDLCHGGELLELFRRNRPWWEPWDPLREEGFYTRAAMDERCREWARSSRQGDGHAWVIRRLPEKSMVGTLGISAVVRGVFQSAYLGYRLDHGHWGLGLMTEALTTLLPYLFGPFGLHRVEANIMPANLVSRRLVERLGFTREGLSPKYLRIAGVWEDHIRYALVTEHWHPGYHGEHGMEPSQPHH